YLKVNLNYDLWKLSNLVNNKEQKSCNALILDLQKMTRSRNLVEFIQQISEAAIILQVIKAYQCVPNLSISSKNENNKKDLCLNSFQTIMQEQNYCSCVNNECHCW
ncbi:7690_t:CDS:1, partial [Entrophospora sp. SA101]